VPYPRKLLNEGEDVVLDLRPHWSTLASPVVAVVVVFAAEFGVATQTDNRVVQWLFLAAAALAVVAFVIRYLKWTNTNFVLTSDRLIYRHGVLAKHGREIPLERINDISFSQRVIERMLGTGDLMIESAGERGQETFADIPKPSKVQNVLYAEMERSKARDADRMAGARQLSVPEQLEKLDELRQRGVISQAEFDAKKQQLLDRM
jgi:uncharacterized membrane protein YdbT with pleckstrin-like domain